MIADSICNNDRISTMQVTFPRFILAELNTHRMFSRNSASSRAIPFNKMVKMVQENPFVPIAWQKDHKGMQGTEYLDDLGQQFSRDIWLTARNSAVSGAEALSKQEVTKQLCNRPLETYMWHTVLITSTEWENFFDLRCSQYVVQENGKDIYYRSKKDLLKSIEEFPHIHEAVSNRTKVQWLEGNKGQAEIHMMALAEAMWDCMNESVPVQLEAGMWHVPFGNVFPSDEDISYELNRYDRGVVDYDGVLNDKIKVATARCARISYQLPGEEDKPANYANDIKLHDRLLQSKHMSPFEHCARAMTKEEDMAYTKTYGVPTKAKPQTIEYSWCLNFRGWIQYRALIDHN